MHLLPSRLVSELGLRHVSHALAGIFMCHCGITWNSGRGLPHYFVHQSFAHEAVSDLSWSPTCASGDLLGCFRPALREAFMLRHCSLPKQTSKVRCVDALERNCLRVTDILRSQCDLGTVSAEIAINLREAGGYFEFSAGSGPGFWSCEPLDTSGIAICSLEGTRHSQLR